MTHALGGWSRESIIEAMEGNFHDVWVEFACRGSRIVRIDDDVSWVMVDPAPWPSHVFGAQFDDAQAEGRIGHIVALMEAGRAPRRWVIGPSSRPIDLQARLERRGLVKLRESPGMAVYLREMDDRFVRPRGLDIARVSDERMLHQWTQVLVSGMFGGGQKDVEAFYDLVKHFDLTGDSHFYIGRYQGEAVATSMLFPSREVAGIYHVVTLPAFRSKGIGKQITLAPLMEARDSGYHVGVLHASPLGEVIYRQIGFRSYCTIGVFALDHGAGD